MTEVFEFARQQNINMLKLHCCNAYQLTPTDHWLGTARLSELSKKSPYLLSHQVTLWKKSFLQEVIPFGENPWQNEKYGTKRLKKSDSPIFQVDVFENNLNLHHNQNHPKHLISEYNGVADRSQLNSFSDSYIDTLIADSELSISEYGKWLKEKRNNAIEAERQPRKTSWNKIKSLFS